MRRTNLAFLFAILVAAVTGWTPTASATSPIEVITGGSGGTSDQKCPTTDASLYPAVTGGCNLHLDGEITLDFHIAGVESTEAKCHLEAERRIDGNGEGYFTAFQITPGKHDADCTNTTMSPCSTAETAHPANDFPWRVHTSEVAAGALNEHLYACIDPGERGDFCEGELNLKLAETGTTTHQLTATDSPVGISGLCELTASLSSEVASPHEGVDYKHVATGTGVEVWRPGKPPEPGVHCPSVASGGCPIHHEGEITTFFHIFGFEGAEWRCSVEFAAQTDEDGNGQITAQSITPGDHDSDCSNATQPPCTGSLPWAMAAEKDADGVVRQHFDVCLDPAESATCSGEFIKTVTEAGTSPETQTWSATDLNLGGSLCELTVALTSEAVAPQVAVHLRP